MFLAGLMFGDMLFLAFVFQFSFFGEVIVFTTYTSAQVGLSLIHDHSGRCFQRAGTKKVTIRDVENNKEATLAKKRCNSKCFFVCLFFTLLHEIEF